MDVLIIGNGFDLAHGLETRYKDFLNFSENVYHSDNEEYTPYKICLETNLWMKHFVSRQSALGDTWIDLEKEIYNVILDLLLKVSELRKPYENNKSLNLQISTYIESFEFSQIGRFINSENTSNPTLDKNYYRINEDYLKRGRLSLYANTPVAFIKFIYDQLRQFTLLFNHYLSEEILKNLNNDTSKILTLSGINKAANYANKLYVLSFNYTDTIERLYKQSLKADYKIELETIYVHGQVSYDSEKCNLVLGSYTFENSEKIRNSEITISPEFNKLRKHNQRHFYGTIEAYQKLLKIVKEKTPTFHIIGHSLDETDSNILEHILLANDDAVINVYYHNEIAQEKLINNITEIIKEKEVMAKVRLIDQYDSTRGMLIPLTENTTCV